MVWVLTKGRHTLAIRPLVRWWLRAPFWPRLLVILAITAVYYVVGSAIILATASTSVPPDPRLLQPGAAPPIRSPFGFLGWFLYLPLGLLIVDALWDRFGTTGEIEAMLRSPEVLVVTRADYLGGHPDLPHGRFVYLVMGGTLQAPLLTIFLPGQEAVQFDLPVLDLGETKERLNQVAHARAGFFGTGDIFREQVFSTEYIGSAGRKHTVDLAYFYRGPWEVRSWRNYLVCLQQEADIGRRPYGPWKTLPKGSPRLEAPRAGVAATHHQALADRHGATGL